MITATLSSSFEDVNKVKEPVVTVTVEVSPSRLMTSLAEGLLAEIQRLIPYQGFKPTADLSVDDILKYVATLVWMRTCHVNSDQSKAYIPYRSMGKRVEVPALVYQMLICIGEAYDRDYSIRFLPRYSVDSGMLLSPDELLALSDILLSLRTIGFASVTGLPRDREGELDFMAMCHVAEVVRSYRDSHPVYGFLASFFAQKELNEVTGLMCRVVYGYDSDYRMYIREALRITEAVQPKAHPNDQKS
jgi:hypothetical protein